MELRGSILRAGAAALALFAAVSARAADWPTPRQGDWIARDFRFATGEVMPELRLHYVTVGEPTGEPVMILHGTAGSAASMLTRDFAGELLAPASPSTRAGSTSSCPTPSGPGNPPSPRTGCGRGSRATTTRT